MPVDVSSATLEPEPKQHSKPTFVWAYVARHVWLHLRPRLHWNQNQHNTTVRTDSRQGSRYQPHYCLCQRLLWNRYDWNVTSQQRPNVWRPQSGFVSSRESGQIRASVCFVAMDKTYIIEILRDMRPLWDERGKNCNNKSQGRILGWNRREIIRYG